MIPLSDVNPTRRTPYITYLLIGINVVVFFWQQTMEPEELFRTFLQNSVVPILVSNNLFSVETALDITRSMFFHGGWTHLGGNMLYLYIFGDNIEDRWGHFPFLIFYFMSGFGASLLQVAVDPDSRIPLIGASGAIAGVLGGYLVLFPTARIRSIVFFGYFIRFIELPALIVLGFWFVLQFFNGVASLGVSAEFSGGVAFFAHIGGFVVGLLLTLLLLPALRSRRHESTVIFDADDAYSNWR
ncbi:MAG: rhomboid family intramembrane serine protease [Chloroflexi bacterium]|nr:MAG: rhomboid family intramembrane serine protease [Phototrophicales bacterium]RMF79237.1 MAG: rhomboid family intramembrane serine protease [Chloroflexota bacterium]